MKYIITESQYNFLLETPNWIKRRLNELERHIEEAKEYFSTPCDFGDEFSYADNVISVALDDFLTKDEDLIDSLSDEYDDVHSYLTDYCKDMFGEELLNEYRSECLNDDEPTN